MEIPLEISCSEVYRLISQPKAIRLIDCREKEEHDHVAIEGSILIPMSEIQERYQELEPQESSPLILYCHHGMRSARVASWLRSIGFQNAQSMSGGIDFWAQEIDNDMIRY